VLIHGKSAWHSRQIGTVAAPQATPQNTQPFGNTIAIAPRPIPASKFSVAIAGCIFTHQYSACTGHGARFLSARFADKPW
jgi:hypothetical protein